MTATIAGDHLLGAEPTSSLLRRTGRLMAPHRRVTAAALTASAVAAIAELLGPVLVGAAIDAVLAADRQRLARVAAGYGALTAGLFAARLARRRLAARASEAFLADLRDRTVTSLLRQPQRFFDRHHAGALLSRATTDIDRLSRFVRDSLPSLVDTLLLLSVTVIVLVGASWQLALVAVMYVPGQVIAARRYRRVSGTAYVDFADAEAATTGAMAETIAARPTLQGLGAGPAWAERMAAVDEQFLAANDAALRADNRLSVLGFWQQFTLAAVLVVGGVLATGGAVSVGVIATFALALRQLFAPLESLAWLYADAQQARVYLARVIGVIDLPGSGSTAAPAYGPPPPVGPGGLELRLDGVGYRYGDGASALADVTLRVAPGERVAIVGATGSGKSTLSKLAAGLLQPEAGTVQLGDRPLAAWPEDLRRRSVALLPQEGFLLRGTLADNLRLAAPTATDDDAFVALARIGLGRWAASLPGGIHTPIADRGSNLSAGERQLIGLARVALVDPAVVILDEATADIDPRTEALVAGALERLTAGRTVLVVAHRPATAERCDRIVTLHAGRIVPPVETQEEP